jgi:uncharacterized protein (DUF433 family)
MTERIISDVKICGGEPCVKGTRVPVRIVLSHLAAGDPIEQLLRDFPNLTAEDIRACLEYASFLATEHVA